MLFKKSNRIRKDYLLRKIRKNIMIVKYNDVRYYEGYNKAILDILEIIEKSNN